MPLRSQTYLGGNFKKTRIGVKEQTLTSRGERKTRQYKPYQCFKTGEKKPIVLTDTEASTISINITDPNCIFVTVHKNSDTSLESTKDVQFASSQSSEVSAVDSKCEFLLLKVPIKSQSDSTEYKKCVKRHTFNREIICGHLKADYNKQQNENQKKSNDHLVSLNPETSNNNGMPQNEEKTKHKSSKNKKTIDPTTENNNKLSKIPKYNCRASDINVHLFNIGISDSRKLKDSCQNCKENSSLCRTRRNKVPIPIEEKVQPNENKTRKPGRKLLQSISSSDQNLANCPSDTSSEGSLKRYPDTTVPIYATMVSKRSRKSTITETGDKNDPLEHKPKVKQRCGSKKKKHSTKHQYTEQKEDSGERKTVKTDHDSIKEHRSKKKCCKKHRGKNKRLENDKKETKSDDKIPGAVAFNLEQKEKTCPEFCLEHPHLKCQEKPHLLPTCIDIPIYQNEAPKRVESCKEIRKQKPIVEKDLSPIKYKDSCVYPDNEKNRPGTSTEKQKLRNPRNFGKDNCPKNKENRPKPCVTPSAEEKVIGKAFFDTPPTAVPCTLPFKKKPKEKPICDKYIDKQGTYQEKPNCNKCKKFGQDFTSSSNTSSSIKNKKLKRKKSRRSSDKSSSLSDGRKRRSKERLQNIEANYPRNISRTLSSESCNRNILPECNSQYQKNPQPQKDLRDCINIPYAQKDMDKKYIDSTQKDIRDNKCIPPAQKDVKDTQLKKGLETCTEKKFFDKKPICKHRHRGTGTRKNRQEKKQYPKRECDLKECKKNKVCALSKSSLEEPCKKTQKRQKNRSVKDSSSSGSGISKKRSKERLDNIESMYKNPHRDEPRKVKKVCEPRKIEKVCKQIDPDYICPKKSIEVIYNPRSTITSHVCSEPNLSRICHRKENEIPYQSRNLVNQGTSAPKTCETTRTKIHRSTSPTKFMPNRTRGTGITRRNVCNIPKQKRDKSCLFWNKSGKRNTGTKSRTKSTVKAPGHAKISCSEVVGTGLSQPHFSCHNVAPCPKRQSRVFGRSTGRRKSRSVSKYGSSFKTCLSPEEWCNLAFLKNERFYRKCYEIAYNCPDYYKAVFGPRPDDTILTGLEKLQNLFCHFCDSTESICGTSKCQIKQRKDTSPVCTCTKSRCICEIETGCTNLNHSCSKRNTPQHSCLKQSPSTPEKSCRDSTSLSSCMKRVVSSAEICSEEHKPIPNFTSECTAYESANISNKSAVYGPICTSRSKMNTPCTTESLVCSRTTATTPCPPPSALCSTIEPLDSAICTPRMNMSTPNTKSSPCSEPRRSTSSKSLKQIRSSFEYFPISPSQQQGDQEVQTCKNIRENFTTPSTPFIEVPSDEVCPQISDSKNAEPCEIRFAITKILIYEDFTTYEIYKSTKARPKVLPTKTEGVFVLKNKR